MRIALGVLLLAATAFPAAAQHDITQVEPVAPDAAIATPTPDQRKMRRYEMPELSGAQQAIGPQLIDGRLPKPLVDFLTTDGPIEQRISIFEGGLVVVKMTGAGSIRKKVVIPPDALEAYRKAISASALRTILPESLPLPETGRSERLRVYDEEGIPVERVFHPSRVLPKQLIDQLTPLRDLLRAISEDREVTTSLAGYVPAPGDRLVADDHKVYEVMRIVDGAGVVELRCLDAPLTIFVARKDLHLYFIGTKPR
jgi:hypothetical protein